MKWFDNLRIFQKLPLVVLGAGFTTAAVGVFRVDTGQALAAPVRAPRLPAPKH